MYNSYLERGLASSVKLKGGKDEVPVVKSFEYRFVGGCFMTVQDKP